MENIMELIVIAALAAAAIYTGLWKLIVPLCLVMYAAFLFAGYRTKRTARAKKVGHAHTAQINPVSRPDKRHKNPSIR